MSEADYQCLIVYNVLVRLRDGPLPTISDAKLTELATGIISALQIKGQLVRAAP